MTDTIISTKDSPGEFDALETAKPDEPIFVVQGGDPLGPPTVQFWADRARECAREIMNGKRAGFDPAEGGEYDPTETDRNDADHLLRKATNAEQVSWAMKSYQRNETQPTGERASYNDSPPVDLSAEAQDREATRKALITMTGQLHNSLAIANGVGEGLASLDLHPDVVRVIVQAVENLKLAAAAIEPRRGTERS